MKKLIYVGTLGTFLTSLFLLIFSCGSDSPSDASINRLTGVWKINRIEFLKDSQGGFPSPNYDIFDQEASSCFFQSNIEFNVNNKVSYNHYNILDGLCEISKDRYLDFTWTHLGGIHYELNYIYFNEEYTPIFEILISSNDLMEMKNVDGNIISYWKKI